MPTREPYGLAKKPVIYLYPESRSDIKVQLDFKGEIIADDPDYDTRIGGWKVTAYPDGTIINHANQQKYPYLFWEGIPEKEIDWDFSQGFVVRGKDTKFFLQDTLDQIGLTTHERNEFIDYWLPRMQDNTYNLIHFAGDAYTAIAPLTIHPKPDSMLRVFMVYKPLDKPVQIEEQHIQPFTRKGFAVVEWGGMQLE